MAVPKRIVSLVPSHTETLHDLGVADAVVGRTRFCIFPAPWVESLPIVGGTKDASFDKIMALEPDLVVADIDENPKALVDQLMAAGVRVIWSEIESVADARAWLIEFSKICGVPDAGVAAARDIDAAIEDIGTKAELAPVFCPIWYGPWMTFNGTAYSHDMLAKAGFGNVFAERSGPRYFEVTADEVAQSGASATLLPTEPFPFHKRRDHVDTAPLGRAGQDGRVHIIDGEALTWFGTRTARGLRELASIRL